ncbi:Arf-Gap With Rho-Gap Domain, Ank Repeat And Ph Domain-Containing Protein 1 [Manis pentadactyla]|nr:Arf-Gap With Rho-Gap Domain, Ank Repeat And Ph Domain-Containing Protein 1 [Manis pentadactyla]
MAGSDTQDELMYTTPPWLAFIFRFPPAPHEAVDSTTASPKTDNDEPMDMTPPSLPIIFWSPPAPHEAVGSTTAGLLCTSVTHCAGGHRSVSPGPTRCRKAPTTAPLDTDKAKGSPSTSPKANADTRDELMDMTPPWLGVMFWSPPAPHEAMGSTTAARRLTLTLKMSRWTRHHPR